MKKTKEELVIERGTNTLKEFYKEVKKDFAIEEFMNLLKEYKKLVKRYAKTIKTADSMGNVVMKKNDSLNDSIQYTIHQARNKILQNIEEHRKTKELSSTYLMKIKDYERELEESYKRNAKLTKKLSFYIKKFGEINDIYDETNIKAELNININPPEYKKLTIKQLILLELTNSKKDLTIIKLALKNFNDMIETIELSSSSINFITGIKKYISNNLKKDDLLFHEKNEIFYIITREKNRNTIKQLMQTINQKRKILGFDITFSMGITTFLETRDTQEIFLKRCENAFKEAELGITPIVIK